MRITEELQPTSFESGAHLLEARRVLLTCDEFVQRFSVQSMAFLRYRVCIIIYVNFLAKSFAALLTFIQKPLFFFSDTEVSIFKRINLDVNICFSGDAFFKFFKHRL